MFLKLFKLKLFKKIKFCRLKESDYVNNEERITEANKNMFISLLYIMSIIFVGLYCASFFVDSIAYNKNIFLQGVILDFVLIILNFVFFNEYNVCLSYLLCIGYFILALKLSVYYFNFMATVLISAFIIIPLVIIDYSKRINGLVVIMCIIAIITSFVKKNSYIAQIDAANFICFSLIGIYLGEKQRYFEIKHFNNLMILSKQRYTDNLTNMLNRRKLFQDITDEINGSVFIGVIMIDIDWFKRLNDTYGHERGDECLKIIGREFVEFGDKNNLKFYRYGGEEFIAISKSYSISKLREVANNLLRIVQQLNIPAEYSPYGRVTVSIGYSEGLINSMAEFENVMGNADKALYKAKDLNRNTCVGYSKNRFV